jgi:hypothetical protein
MKYPRLISGERRIGFLTKYRSHCASRDLTAYPVLSTERFETIELSLVPRVRGNDPWDKPWIAVSRLTCALTTDFLGVFLVGFSGLVSLESGEFSSFMSIPRIEICGRGGRDQNSLR